MGLISVVISISCCLTCKHLCFVLSTKTDKLEKEVRPLNTKVETICYQPSKNISEEVRDGMANIISSSYPP